MKIIEEIFEVILKFRTHLISYEWHQDEEDGITHPAYDTMCNVYKVFKECARFLFKGMAKFLYQCFRVLNNLSVFNFFFK